MIIRKPYAFLIKHFKLIHFVMLVLSIYIVNRANIIFNFFNEYVTTRQVSSAEYISSNYLPLFLFISVQATPGGADVPVSGGMPFAARGGAVFRIVGIQHGRFADAAQIGNDRRGFLRRAGVPLQPHGSGNRDARRREQAKRQKNAQKPNQTMHDDNSPPNPGCPVLRRAIRRRTDIVAGGAYNYTHGGHDK